MMNRRTLLRDNFGTTVATLDRMSAILWGLWSETRAFAKQANLVPQRSELHVLSGLHCRSLGGFLSMDGAQWGLLGTSIGCKEVVPFLPNKGE